MRTKIITIIVCICYSCIANAQSKEVSTSAKRVNISHISDKEKKKSWYKEYVKPLDRERMELEKQLNKVRKDEQLYKKEMEERLDSLQRLIKAYQFIQRTDVGIYKEYKANDFQGIEEEQLVLIGDVQKIGEILKRLEISKQQIDAEYPLKKRGQQYKESFTSDVDEAYKLVDKIIKGLKVSKEQKEYVNNLIDKYEKYNKYVGYIK